MATLKTRYAGEVPDTDESLLAGGFTLEGENGAQLDTCPHCKGDVDETTVTIQGDDILCKACGKSIINPPKRRKRRKSRRPTDFRGVNRREFDAAWEEQFSLDGGDHDYELGD